MFMQPFDSARAERSNAQELSSRSYGAGRLQL
jgi:hypothetical protein